MPSKTHHNEDRMDYERFVPTPDWIVPAKLELARIGPGETLYDLGCGDGSVLISAAQTHSIRGVGVEIRDDLVTSARAAVRAHNLEDFVEVRQEDYLVTDLANADVVIIYLNRMSLGPLSIKFEAELRPETRIITHQFDLPGWSAERQLNVRSPDGVEETVFCYRQQAR